MEMSQVGHLHDSLFLRNYGNYTQRGEFVNSPSWLFAPKCFRCNRTGEANSQYKMKKKQVKEKNNKEFTRIVAAVLVFVGYNMLLGNRFVNESNWLIVFVVIAAVGGSVLKYKRKKLLIIKHAFLYFIYGYCFISPVYGVANYFYTTSQPSIHATVKIVDFYRGINSRGGGSSNRVEVLLDGQLVIIPIGNGDNTKKLITSKEKYLPYSSLQLTYKKGFGKTLFVEKRVLSVRKSLIDLPGVENIGSTGNYVG